MSKNSVSLLSSHSVLRGTPPSNFTPPYGQLPPFFEIFPKPPPFFGKSAPFFTKKANPLLFFDVFQSLIKKSVKLIKNYTYYCKKCHTLTE